MPHLDTRPCIDCGEPATRVVRGDRAWVCVECAAHRMRENNEQLRAKSGPHYRRWKAAMQATAHLIARGIDP